MNESAHTYHIYWLDGERHKEKGKKEKNFMKSEKFEFLLSMMLVQGQSCGKRERGKNIRVKNVDSDCVKSTQ